MDAYAKGLQGKGATWAAKKYRGHRVLPESILADFDIVEKAGKTGYIFILIYCNIYFTGRCVTLYLREIQQHMYGWAVSHRNVTARDVGHFRVSPILSLLG